MLSYLASVPRILKPIETSLSLPLTRNVPVAHHLEGASWTLSYNELRLSTASYCYAD